MYAAARAGVLAQLGFGAVVHAAGVAAMFDGINVLADVTGCQFDAGIRNNTQDLAAFIHGELSLHPPVYEPTN